MKNTDLIALSLLLGPVLPLVARSEVYLTDQQAVAAIFPKVPFQKKTAVLTEAEWTQLKSLFGESLRSKNLIVWKDAQNDLVFIDQALGKHEFITFAVGINAAGQVKGIEILEYNESYGQQIRDESWRQQFVGKTKDSPLKLGDDITNISGATLSSTHVTAGVKRILTTYETVKNRL